MSDSKASNAALESMPSIRCIADITGRENYKTPLEFQPDHKDRNFGGIITPYHLPNTDGKIKCGISVCGKPHWHGYLITTSDGLETNIGKDCGTKHFSADFHSEMKRHDALYERQLKVERIIALKSEAKEILGELTSLKTEYDFLKSLRYKLKGVLSRPEGERVLHKLKTGDLNLYRYEARSKEEREVYLEVNPSARRTGEVPPNQIKVGELLGLSFFGATHKIEEVFNFITPLKTLVAADQAEIYDWANGEINKTHSWFGSAKSVDTVRAMIVQGRLLFTTENIRAMHHLDISEASLESAIQAIRNDMLNAGLKMQ